MNKGKNKGIEYIIQIDNVIELRHNLNFFLERHLEILIVLIAYKIVMILYILPAIKEDKVQDPHFMLFC